MASRLPWFRMHQDDWLAHARLRRCSVEARGVWIDLICSMRQEEAGTLHDDVDGMARSIGLPAERLLALLEELHRRDVAEVAVANGRVTVTSRRVTRDLEDEERERDDWREQKAAQRSRKPHVRQVSTQVSTQVSGDCPVDVRLESQSQKKNQTERSNSPTPGSSSSKVPQPSVGLRALARAPEAEGRMGDGEKSEPPKPCSRCTEGFDAAAQRCCSCPAGRERARRVTSAAAADRDQAARAAARGAAAPPAKSIPFPELVARIAAKASPANATASRAPPIAQVDSRVDQRIATQ